VRETTCQVAGRFGACCFCALQDVVGSPPHRGLSVGGVCLGAFGMVRPQASKAAAHEKLRAEFGMEPGGTFTAVGWHYCWRVG